MRTWDAGRYDTGFGYVAAYGGGVLDLLDPRPGERVLDLGCGTGTLTAGIAARGATALGVDADPTMVARARERSPELTFTVADGHDFTVDRPVDAVFSNAALHWMTRPAEVLRRVAAALRPGGRFVAEFGAARNIAGIHAAVTAARRRHHLGDAPMPWYFPTPAEYATRLEAAGFTVRLLCYFDRPTPLAEEGVAGWLTFFGPPLVEDLPAADRGRVLAEAAEEAAANPALRRPDGWHADYVRLRFAAQAG